MKGFTDALETFRQTPGSQVWIAAAAFGPISAHNFAQSAVDIEMCMTVTTHPAVPITTHMGIFRSPLRCLKISSLDGLRRLDGSNQMVTVGDVRIALGENALKKYLWLAVLADLNGGRPKIAIDIKRLAGTMNERTRVEATLDWLETWA